jgi:hypothetical protein
MELKDLLHVLAQICAQAGVLTLEIHRLFAALLGVHAHRHEAGGARHG